MSTALKELAARVTELADRYSGTDQESLALNLYEVERSLNEARRRLSKLLQFEDQSSPVQSERIGEHQLRRIAARVSLTLV